MLPPNHDPDGVTDKAACEREIAADLAAWLSNAHGDLGPYEMAILGSYPDTILKVSGRNIRTEKPAQWEFALWDAWRDWGNVSGTVTVLYAALAD